MQQPQIQQRRTAARSMALVAIGGITLTVAMSATAIMLSQQHTANDQHPLALTEQPGKDGFKHIAGGLGSPGAGYCRAIDQLSGKPEPTARAFASVDRLMNNAG